MRTWIIVVSSTVLALVAAAAVIRPELSSAPPGPILPSLISLLPAVLVAALTVYALCAILLTSGNLIVGGLQLRHYLAHNPPHTGSAWPDWTTAFDSSGLQRLVPPRAAVQPSPVPADGIVVLQGPFEPREARREVARLYYIGAARAHFFSALVVLVAGVVLGAAQAHGPLSFLPGLIPTVPAALAVAGLVLLAIVARIAVDVAAEPLIETISRLPAETTEIGLLRRVAELFAACSPANQPSAAAAHAPTLEIPERLDEILEQGHRALFEAIERLSVMTEGLAATTEGLATTTRSSVEALEAAFRAAELREPAGSPYGAGDAAVMSELRDAVRGLTAVLEHVGHAAAVEGDIEPPVSRGHGPDLALELRKLLQEMETTS
jgi:hypothetical protein